MLVNLVAAKWGPKFIVPTIAINKYHGCVVLRENLDDELLKKELETLQISGTPTGYSNSWYIRKKGTNSWMKVGESSRREEDFRVRLDTAEIGNGSYQVLGFMSVKVKSAEKEVVVSSQSIADFEIKN
jgi:hypothetical protein